MNFFKKFYRRKTLSILDDTQNKQKDVVKVRPGSGGLRRSGGLSRTDDYNTSETKLFEVSIYDCSVCCTGSIQFFDM